MSTSSAEPVEVPDVTDADVTSPVDTEAPPVDTDEPEQDQDELVEQDEDRDEGPSREAAKWRRRLRDAEAERDALAARLDGLQRAGVESIAAEVLSKPAGLWAAGTQLADLLDESGAVDRGKVRDAAAAAAEQLGLGRATPAMYVAREGTIPSRPGSGGTMQDVIMGR